MKKPDTTFVITSLLCLLPIALGIYLYDQLPDQIIIHWNAAGVADGFAPKLPVIFGLPIFLFAMNAFVHFAINTDPKNQGQHSKLMVLGKWLIPIIALIIMPMSLFASLGANVPIVPIIIAMIGCLFIVVGNYMPKTQQSYTVGIKLPWTLNSAENWNKTHRFAGYLWMTGGFVLIVSGFFPSLWLVVFFTVLVMMVGIPFGYSYYLYKKGI